MRRVLEHIAKQRSDFANHPFLVHLRGPGSVEQARAVVPRVAFFVLGFQDVLRLAYQRSTDPKIRSISKTHWDEDAGHDDWYLHDLEQFGLSLDVRWLFSPEHQVTRDVSFTQLATVISAKDDSVRVSAIMALEATGAECFAAMIDFLERVGYRAPLRYFARSHQHVEAAHEVFAEDDPGGLETIVVPEAALEDAIEAADSIFSSMARMLDDLDAAFVKAGETESAEEAFADIAPVATDPATLREASGDFGRLVRGESTAVVRPRSADEVEQLVRRAGERRISLTPRGRGLGQSGQSVPRRGATLLLDGLDAIGEVDVERRTITCGPAATWRRILERTAARGLAPEVMPLNLDLGIGGALSAGGLGTTSHRYGFAASSVRSAEVVTGTGRRVRCGPNQERSVYDAVFGGTGRAGVITEVELGLRPFGVRSRTHFLRYFEIEPLVRDMLALSERDDVHHIEGFCAASVQGLRKSPRGRTPFAHWSYGLHITSEFAEDGVAPAGVLEGLRFSESIGEEEDTTREFLSRYDVRFEMMRGTGAWELPHPWFEVFLPIAGAETILARALEIMPLTLGDGHRLMVISDRDRPKSIALPPGGPALCLAVLPQGIPPAFREPTLHALRRLEALCTEAGGRRYVSGWLPEYGEEAWRRHYGEDYETVRELQRELDPDEVFDSCLGLPA